MFHSPLSAERLPGQALLDRRSATRAAGLSSWMRGVRARVPLRLGLAGGGTDVSPYCDAFGGAVLNLTIDRFVFATVQGRDDGDVVLQAEDMSLEERFGPEQPIVSERLGLHAAAYLRMMQAYNGGRRLAATIKTTVDAPPGSGLGSSSALVVALVEALRVALGAPLGPYDVARLAYTIERVDVGLSGGRQDQYAATFGGVNYIEFRAGDEVTVQPLRVDRSVLRELESSIVTCFTGRSRESARIIERQITAMATRDGAGLQALHRLKADATAMRQALLAGDIDAMAAILNSSWRSKQSTAEGVSNGEIDQLLELALTAGALAGKVSGAGGGGFMFFLVHPERRFGLIERLRQAGADAKPVMFTAEGAETWCF